MKKIFVSFLIVLGVWTLATASRLVNPLFLPTPFETYDEGVRLLAERVILLDLWCSMARIVSGVALAAAVGIPLGILVGYFGRFSGYIEPALDFFRSIPPILVFPLSLLIFGVGEEARVAVIFFGCILPLLLNVSRGVMRCNVIRIKVAKLMGANWLVILLRVVFFDALPHIFTGIRVSISMGIIVGIVTEMLVGVRHGLGSRVVYAQTSYATPEMYFTIILVGVLGFLINNAMVYIERNVVHWKAQE